MNEFIFFGCILISCVIFGVTNAMHSKDDVLELHKGRYSQRGLTLPNGIKLILISDPNVTSAFASAVIPSGHLDDPKELPGLAHFCEHLVFMGNDKYPREDEHFEFFYANGGDQSAETSSDLTTFYFHVMPESLEEALDRLSQIFISPLFRESALEREVHSMDSEFKNVLSSDHYREFKIDEFISNHNSTYANFEFGNLQTLWTLPREKGLNVREKVIEFHEKHYSSNVMHLVVLGKEDLNKLQEITEKIFLKVPNRNVSKNNHPKNPYSKCFLGRKTYIKAIEDNTKTMSIRFPLPVDSADNTSSVAAAYISELIEHWGQGGLPQKLRDLNLTTSLTATPYEPYEGFYILHVIMNLTSSGLQNTDDVICNFFQYIDFIREEGPQQRFWEQNQKLDEIDFKYFRHIDYDMDSIKELSALMTRTPMEYFLSDLNIFPEYSPSRITDILNSLVPANSKITIVSAKGDVEFTYKEQYLGIEFGISKNNQLSFAENSSMCKRNQAFSFPKRNVFIPDRFEIKTRESTAELVPKKIIETDFSDIWFPQDYEFLQPKAFIKCFIHSPIVDSDHLHITLTDIYIKQLIDNLERELQDAQLAGYSYEISSLGNGIEISVSGFDNKISLVLGKIMDNVINFRVYSNVIKDEKDRLKSLLHYTVVSDPCVEADYRLGLHLGSNDIYDFDFEQLTEETLKEFASNFLNELQFQWFFYRNLLQNEVIKMTDKEENKFLKRGTKSVVVEGSSEESDEVPAKENKETESKKGFRRLFQPNIAGRTSSCTNVFFQTEELDTKSLHMLFLLKDISYNYAFIQLRTKEQLGYSVSTSIRVSDQGSAQGLEITVHGDKDPSFVELRIHKFTVLLESLMKNITESEFIQWRIAYSFTSLQEDLSVENKVTNFWRGILYDDEADSAETMQGVETQLETKRIIESISKWDLLKFFQEHVLSNTAKRISTHVPIHTNEIVQGSLVKEATNFDDLFRAECTPSGIKIVEPNAISDENNNAQMTPKQKTETQELTNTQNNGNSMNFSVDGFYKGLFVLIISVYLSV